MQASIYTNQKYYDEKLNKFLNTVASIISKFIEKLDHISHQIQIPSQDNYVEEYGISDISLFKVTSQNIFVSYDLAPDLDIFQEINKLFSEPYNIYTQTPHLQTQTRFVTPLSCDLKPDITKPTSRKIFVSLISIA